MQTIQHTTQSSVRAIEMPNTFSQLYIHVVFSVKGRENLIHNKLKDELYKYLCGIVTGNNEKVYSINGMPDHIHILLSIKPNCTLSDLKIPLKGKEK